MPQWRLTSNFQFENRQRILSRFGKVKLIASQSCTANMRLNLILTVSMGHFLFHVANIKSRVKLQIKIISKYIATMIDAIYTYSVSSDNYTRANAQYTVNFYCLLQ